VRTSYTKQTCGKPEPGDVTVTGRVAGSFADARGQRHSISVAKSDRPAKGGNVAGADPAKKIGRTRLS
jgi:hypothetical protein